MEAFSWVWPAKAAPSTLWSDEDPYGTRPAAYGGAVPGAPRVAATPAG